MSEQADETFVKFNYKKKGFLTRHIPPMQSSDDGFSLGEVACELALTNRPPAADEDSGAESGTDDGSEGGEEEL